MSKEHKYTGVKLPELPSVVVKYLESSKTSVTLDEVMHLVHTRTWEVKCGRVFNWIEDNVEAFSLAWITGKYRVIEDKYIVIFWGDRDFDNFYHLAKDLEGNVFSTFGKDSAGRIFNDSFYLTEKEIKDYDKRYWVFAKLVEGDLQ